MRLLAKLLLVGAAGGLAVFAIIVGTGATTPFNPALQVTLYDPHPSANSSAIIVTSVGSGDLPLDTWALDLPSAWSVSGGAPVGDLVAEGTMTIDLDCDGVADLCEPICIDENGDGVDDGIDINCDGNIDIPLG